MSNITSYLSQKSRLKIKYRVPSIRQSQNLAIDCATSFDRCSIQMPTGSGKSLVIRSIAYYYADQNYTVFIIVPSYDIGEKIWGDIACETIGLKPVFHAPKKVTELHRDSKIVITTYQSFWRRIDQYRNLFSKSKLVAIYDESHHVNVLAPRNFSAACSFDNMYSISASPWSPFCLSITKNRYIYKIKDAISDGVVSNPIVSSNIPSTDDISVYPEIWYYPSIESALESIGKTLKIKAGKELLVDNGNNKHLSAMAGFTCSKEHLSTPDLVKLFNKGKIRRAIVVNQLKEGFDSNLVVDNKKVPVKRVVILSDEISPISLYQRAGRALRPGGGLIYCQTFQKDVLNYAFELANGRPIVCQTCGEEHLSTHHNAVKQISSEMIDNE